MAVVVVVSITGRSGIVGAVETLPLENMVLALERAQIFFSIALGLVALLITFFAVYVTWSTMWSDRWYREGPAADAANTPEADT